MRHNPAAGAIVIMLRSLKMHGMAQAVGELTEQGSPAFEAALPILSQLLKAETADREVRSTAYQLKAARFPNYRDLAGFDFASKRGQRGARASTPSLRVPGRRAQCRPGRRPRHGQDASRHRDRRPGHRASPQARKVLLHRRTRQRSRTREASGQTRPDRGAAHPLRSRHP